MIHKILSCILFLTFLSSCVFGLQYSGKEEKVSYNISIFDDSKDTSKIEKNLIKKGFTIEEVEDVFGMNMFYISKIDMVDKETIQKNEADINSIVNVDWLSYDGWVILDE